MTSAILNSLEQLDSAISERIRIEGAFIDTMVQEFASIQRDLDQCLQSHGQPSDDLAQVSQRLAAAIQRLQNDAPLNNEQGMNDAVSRVLQRPRTPLAGGRRTKRRYRRT